MKKKSRISLFIIAIVVICVIVFFLIKPSTIPKIVIFNLLSHPILDDSVSGILDGLSLNGIDEANYEIIMINANGEMDKLNTLAKEVLLLKPKLIIPVSTPVTNAVFSEADPEQMILFSTVTNPDDVKMQTNPPNMTGVCDVVNYNANLNLIREMFPIMNKKKRKLNVGFLYNPAEANSVYGLKQIEDLIKEDYNFKLHVLPVTSVNEVIDGAQALVRKIDVFYVGSDNTVVSAISALNSVAKRYNIPVIASDAGSVNNEALAAISVNYYELGLYAGRKAAEIIKNGAMPDDRTPHYFLGESLLINQNTANNIRYKFSQDILNKADQVIE